MNLPTYLTGNVQTRAYAILRETVYSVLEKYNLTPTHWAMLGIVHEARDGIRQSEIAKALNVKPPLITVMARYLIEQGVIMSTPNQFDTRSKLLSVTPSGKKFIKSVETELHNALENLLTGLNEKDLLTYHRVLETIILNQKSLDSRES